MYATKPGLKARLRGAGKSGIVLSAVLMMVFASACQKNSEKASAANQTQASGTALKTNLTGTDFRIAVIPDIQFYTAQAHGGTVAMFRSQISWIKSHAADSNIVYVAGLGDNVDDTNEGSPLTPNLTDQWTNVTANGGFYALETPSPGIPYGVAVGNHDEADHNYDRSDLNHYHNHPGFHPTRNTTAEYNTYFGPSHFAGRSYYGGHSHIAGKGVTNDCHFDKFTVDGVNYIVIYMAFDNTNEDTTGEMLKYADTVLNNHTGSKAIIVSHSIINNVSPPYAFGPQGQKIYDAMKTHANVFLMLGGHLTGEAKRVDSFGGNTITTYLTDYQGKPNGGGGKMRTMLLNTVSGVKGIRSFIP